jgi:hypothetical protein
MSFYGDAVQPFSGGLAMVRIGERAGFIDKTGNFVIQPQFLMQLPLLRDWHELMWAEDG